MDIIGIVTNLISGGIGGNVAGAASKDLSLGAIGNTIAGAIGGTAGAWILQAVGILNSMGLSEVSLSSLAGGAATSVVSGGIITAIIGLIKNKTSGS